MIYISVTPHFITKPENEVITIGRNVTLTCVANGYPKPEITWLFNVSIIRLGFLLFCSSINLSAIRQKAYEHIYIKKSNTWKY